MGRTRFLVMVAFGTMGVMHGMSDHREPYAGVATQRLKWPYTPARQSSLPLVGAVTWPR